MQLITRRTFLAGATTLTAATGFGGYAVAYEPRHVLTTHYRFTPPGWPKGLRLRLVALTDLHACEPWIGASEIAAIVQHTNALEPDAILLLGDFVAGRTIAHFGEALSRKHIATLLSVLKAPLGVHAVLGNHDWWEEPDVQRALRGPTEIRGRLEDVGIAVYENDAVRLAKDGKPFWLAGIGDQWAFFGAARGAQRRHLPRFGYNGIDDLPGTLAKVTDDAPIVLMVHEPDIFTQVPARVAVTLAGHTHGGQVRLFGYAPKVPSEFGNRFVYGHIVENDRHMIVSSGLGCSGVPVRFGAPPEIIVLELGAGDGIA